MLLPMVGAPHSNSRPGRNKLALLMLALVGLAALVALLVLLWPKPEAQPLPTSDSGNTLAAPADAAPPSPDLMATPRDTSVERTPPRRGTRLISAAEVRTVQRRHRALLQLCYDRASRGGLVPRRANVQIKLGDRGRVRAVSVNVAGKLGACLQRMVRGFRFPRSLKPQTVRFAFVFASRR